MSVVIPSAWPVTVSSGLGAKVDVEVGEAGVFFSLKTDCRDQLSLHCCTGGQCLLCSDLDRSSVQNEEKA